MPTIQSNPERVVIVGKTHMGSVACVGGIVEQSRRPVRLLPPGGFAHPPQTPFQVGDVWEMRLRACVKVEPPHTEDHDEWDARKVGAASNLVEFIRSAAKVWVGEADGLFGGLLRFRAAGTGYLTRSPPTPLPAWSVEFWVLPRTLAYSPHDGRHRYHVSRPTRFDIPYVGYAPPVGRLPAGTLVRVSLARWWVNPHAPEEGETCSLQLSGWFGLPVGAVRAPVAPTTTPRSAEASGGDMLL